MISLSNWRSSGRESAPSKNHPQNNEPTHIGCYGSGEHSRPRLSGLTPSSNPFPPADVSSGGAGNHTRGRVRSPPVVHPKLIRPNKKRPPYPKAAWRFLQFNLRLRCRGRWSRRSSRSCGCAGGRKGVQTELVANAGVGGIADGPLQVGGVLNGQQPFV